jgi:serine/threonine protein kinase
MDDPFQLITQLGHSAWCTVYLAEQRSPNRPVILKLLNGHIASDPQKVQHFNTEAEALKNLRHPHIASLVEYGINSYGQPYLAYEHFRGQLLNEFQLNGLIAVPTALTIGKQICEALMAAHQNGIIHRDLRPQSVFLATDSGAEIDVKVFDFSFAKLLSVDHLSFEALTETGMLMSSPMYMSPEQCLGEDVDARADVYSLGCIIYDMLSGQTPFQDASGPFQTVQSHLHMQPVPISKLMPDSKIPASLDELVMCALQKNPDERFDSMADMLSALNKIDLTQKKPSKLPARVAVGGLLVCMAAVVGWMRLHQGAQTVPPVASSPHVATTRSSQPDAQEQPAQQQSNAGPFDPQQKARLLCDQAAASFREGKYAEAQGKYSLALQADPTAMDAYEGRALVNLKLGRTQEAIADCDAYVAHNTDDAAAYYCMGRLYRSVGNDTQALFCLGKSLALAPDAAAYCDRGLLYLRMSKPMLAQKDLAAIDAMAGTPRQSMRSAQSCRALLAGALNVYAGKYRNALPHLTSVLAENPTWKEAYVLRARCYDKLGQFGLAAKDRARASQLTDLSDLEVGG